MKHLSDFIHELDVVHAKPAVDWIQRKLEHVVVAGLSLPKGSYVAYLADAREVTDPQAGEPLSGSVAVRLPEGRYRATLFSPTAGERSPGVTVQGGSQAVEVDLGDFCHDVVLELKRRGD